MKLLGGSSDTVDVRTLCTLDVTASAETLDPRVHPSSEATYLIRPEIGCSDGR